MVRLENSKMVWCDANNGTKYKNDYVCDTADDLPETTDLVIGSTAIVIGTGKVYILDGDGEWQDLTEE